MNRKIFHFLLCLSSLYFFSFSVASAQDDASSSLSPGIGVYYGIFLKDFSELSQLAGLKLDLPIKNGISLEARGEFIYGWDVLKFTDRFPNREQEKKLDTILIPIDLGVTIDIFRNNTNSNVRPYVFGGGSYIFVDPHGGISNAFDDHDMYNFRANNVLGWYGGIGMEIGGFFCEILHRRAHNIMLRNSNGLIRREQDISATSFNLGFIGRW
jgi:hypothetical protein